MTHIGVPPVPKPGERMQLEGQPPSLTVMIGMDEGLRRSRPRLPKNRLMVRQLALAKLILAWQDVRKINTSENRFSLIISA